MAASEQLEPLQGYKLVLGTLALALGSFMNVLDMSIANVALPTIAGDFAVSPTQGTWVITSYAVSEAIFLPLTGFLSKRIGEVRAVWFGTILSVFSNCANIARCSGGLNDPLISSLIDEVISCG